jgi:hypothetical protein
MEEKYNLGKILEGKMVRGMPFLKVKIKGIKLPKELSYYENGIDAIFDTGANRTHITPSFAKILNLKPIRVDPGFYVIESGISMTNVYNINFNIKGLEYNFEEEFKALPYEFQFPLIFGTEFLIKCKTLNMDFISESYELEL